MAVFTTERTARKPHKCSRCGRVIESGERYTTYSIPPGSDLGNERWISGREHLSEIGCMYLLADDPLPDAPDGPWEDQAIPAANETAATAGEGQT